MDNKIVAEQINEMTQALNGTEEEVRTHCLDREKMFIVEDGRFEINMRFANEILDPRILAPAEGDATISYRDENAKWVEEKLDPEQQEILNRYARIASKAIQEVMESPDDEEMEMEMSPEDERALAESGYNEEKQESFRYLLGRTLVMSQATTRNLIRLEEKHPDNEEFKVDRAAMETAFHCLLAAAFITDTGWEQLE